MAGVAAELTASASAGEQVGQPFDSAGRAYQEATPAINYKEGEVVRKKLLYLLRLAVLKREILGGGAGWTSSR